MIWDSAVFQSINECRKYAPKNEKGEIELNGEVHRFINKCFFETQAIAIRRLVDRRSDVISLYRLVDDMEKHSGLLTRRNILAAHDYPYEYEQEERRLSEEAFRNVPSGTVVCMGQDYHMCVLSENTHKSIDSLAGLQPSQRSPDDAVPRRIFDWLTKKLSRCEEISLFVNKFLAHAASPKSRSYLNPPDLNVTLGQILEANKIVCQIVFFIGSIGIVDGFGNFLAAPQFNQFEHFEKPWATKGTIEKLHKFWREYDKQTRTWQDWDWEGDFNKDMQQSNLL